MIDIRQKAIEKSRRRVVRVSRLIGFSMMYMMRDDIDLFRYDADSKIPGEKTPEFITELIGPVRAIPVIQDCAVRSHHDHTVNKSCAQQSETEVLKYE